MPDINGIPYVESSDIVSAYPAASQALAQEVSDQLASKLDLAGGKILQIVRSTDSTTRTTTSTSFVDASISVTITPQKSDSAVLIWWSFASELTVGVGAGDGRGAYRITDNSNNAIAGAEEAFVGPSSTGASEANNNNQSLLAYATPATTSAVTYKGRFRTLNATCTTGIRNASRTGQMYAIEVSA